ncbi:MAG: DNA-deoxyinosine glycosylase [Clostridia bacterium]
MEKRHVTHTFSAVIDSDCKILILGSVPSVNSMREQFYYAHKQNRFWKVLSAILNIDLTTKSKEEKSSILLQNHIALYDSVYECDIVGSSDNKIENIVHTDIKKLIANTQITHIFANGQKAFDELIKGNPWTSEISTKLPSTSPANAQFSLEKLLSSWTAIKEYI